MTASTYGFHSDLGAPSPTRRASLGASSPRAPAGPRRTCAPPSAAAAVSPGRRRAGASAPLRHERRARSPTPRARDHDHEGDRRATLDVARSAARRAHLGRQQVDLREADTGARPTSWSRACGCSSRASCCHSVREADGEGDERLDAGRSRDPTVLADLSPASGSPSVTGSRLALDRYCPRPGRCAPPPVSTTTSMPAPVGCCCSRRRCSGSTRRAAARPTAIASAASAAPARAAKPMPISRLTCSASAAAIFSTLATESVTLWPPDGQRAARAAATRATAMTTVVMLAPMSTTATVRCGELAAGERAQQRERVQVDHPRTQAGALDRERRWRTRSSRWAATSMPWIIRPCGPSTSSVG